jgi:hypothetical protein
VKSETAIQILKSDLERNINGTRLESEETKARAGNLRKWKNSKKDTEKSMNMIK